MNRNLVLGLTLAIFVILACSFTSGAPIVPAEVPPTTVPNEVEPTQQPQDQMATFVAQTVEAQQAAATEPPVQATLTPTTAAPVLPKAPANFYANSTCTKVVAHSFTEYKFVFTTNLTWEDRSDNETAFEISKDGKLLATLDADTTKYQDTLTFMTPYKHPTQMALFTIQAINAAGKSEAVEVSVSPTCR